MYLKVFFVFLKRNMIYKYVCVYVFLDCHHTREITSFQSVSFGDIVFGDSRVHETFSHQNPG